MAELERLKIRRALVDDKPETTRHSTCNKPLLLPGYIQQHLYLFYNVGFIGNKREIFQFNETREIPLNMGDERLSNLSLMHIHRHVQVDLDMIINDFVSRRNWRLDFS